MITGAELRGELVRRFAFAEQKLVRGYPKRRSVTPV